MIDMIAGATLSSSCHCISGFGIETACNYLKTKSNFKTCFVKNMFTEMGFDLVSTIYK